MKLLTPRLGGPGWTEEEYLSYTHKACTGPCKEVKPVGEFARMKSKVKIGWAYNGSCKTCHNAETRRRRVAVGNDAHNERIKAWRKANPAKDRTIARRNDRNRLTKGLTHQEVELMKAHNEHKCWICQRPVKLVMDHCHTTGFVRGAICSPCNYFVGIIKDDQEAVMRLHAYLAPELLGTVVPAVLEGHPYPVF